MKRIVSILLVILMLYTVYPSFAEEAIPAVFSDQLAEHFLAAGETPVIGDMSYISENLSIEINYTREYKSDVFIADI